MAEGGSGGARQRWLIDVARWRPSQAQFHAAAALLPPHERHAVSRFVNDDDRKRALVSRLLQYSLACCVLALSPHQMSIRRTAHGKPYLHAVILKQRGKNVAGFNFNVSHQGDYVGIASEPLCLVGLDIVSLSKPRGEPAMEFIKNFSSHLTVHEWSCIVRIGTPDEMLAEFYRYWCLKEAFVKAIGAGVGFGFHRLEFHHVQWTSISIFIDGCESRNWRFWLFEIDKIHLASIAKGHPVDAVDSFKRTFSDTVVEEEELCAAIEAPEETFSLLTVEQLTQILSVS